jgi:hypothetical protein
MELIFPRDCEIHSPHLGGHDTENGKILLRLRQLVGNHVCVWFLRCVIGDDPIFIKKGAQTVIVQ